MDALVPIFFFLSVAAVAILRPVTKRLGVLLEALARERTSLAQGGAASQLSDAQWTRINTVLEQLDSRMDRIEDRLQFMERLSDSKPLVPRKQIVG